MRSVINKGKVLASVMLCWTESYIWQLANQRLHLFYDLYWNLIVFVPANSIKLIPASLTPIVNMYSDCIGNLYSEVQMLLYYK